MKQSGGIYEIDEFILQLTELSSSDILVNAEETSPGVYAVDQLSSSYPVTGDPAFRQLIRKAVLHKRNQDTDTFMLAFGGIEWTYKNKKVCTPVLLFPAGYHHDKVRQQYTVSIEQDNFFLNPFLKNELLRSYDIVLEPAAEKEYSHYLTNIYDLLREKGFLFAERELKLLGNFHHHRFHILRDLELLKEEELSPLVKNILGHEAADQPEELPLEKQNILPSDPDQLRIFDLFRKGNLVIQGPPGTGKSQVLTNLLGKLLIRPAMQLVVSEKRVALEVLYQKLKNKALDHFVFLAHDRTRSSDFVEKLKQTWSFLEDTPVQSVDNWSLSEQKYDQLQLMLDKLSSKELMGGIDLTSFKRMLKDYSLTDYTYKSALPSLKEWMQQRAVVKSITERTEEVRLILPLIRYTAFGQLKYISQQLSGWMSALEEWKTRFNISTFSDLHLRVQQLPRCVLIENENYKRYSDIYTSSRKRKLFEKLKKQFLVRKAVMEQYRMLMADWKEFPSPAVYTSWKNNREKSFWKRRKTDLEIRNRLHTETGTEEALHFLGEYFRNQQLLIQTESELIGLGIERPELELESISYIFRQLDQEEENELNSVSILEESERKELVKDASQLQSIYRELERYFAMKNDTDLHTLFKEIQQYLLVLIGAEQDIQDAGSSIYSLLQEYDNFYTLEKQVLSSGWAEFSARFPDLAALDGQRLLHLIEETDGLEQREREDFARQIIQAKKERFEAFHILLRTPSARLSAIEKERKKQLKKGKAILVREFGKSRQHLSVRELCDSDASFWIELLLPVWMMTPGQVAVHLPLKRSLVETVIFDEASQLQLPYVLGALHRAERAVVAGDEQQMSPSSYFSGQKTSVDLLHQATFYWNKGKLKHHYRSEHPELIRFSNRYFYNNELMIFPSATAPAKAVHLHYIEKGIYTERQNKEEAAALASLVSPQILSGKNIGITAFSEQQLTCIWNHFPTAVQQVLQEKIEEGSAFFKPLEQVQGDECDHLYISIGYGKNEHGEFHLKFGPLNQQGGAKRLNVLLTRARTSMHIFSSVRSSDFALSDNEPVNLLRILLSDLEKEGTDYQPVFPFGLVPAAGSRRIEIENCAQLIPSAKELVHLHVVLKERGWIPEYIL